MTKRNYIKKLVSLILAITIATGCFLYQPQEVQASDVDTLSAKYIEGMNAICFDNIVMDIAMYAYMTERMKPGQKKTLNFSTSASARKYVMKYAGATLPAGVSEEQANKNKTALNKTSKLLFGKTTPGAKVVAMDAFADYQPKIECGWRDIDCTRINKNKYVVYANLREYDRVYGGSTLVGLVELVLKKKPSSQFKWIIEKAKLYRSEDY